MNNSSGNSRNDSERRIGRRHFLQSTGKIAGAVAVTAGLGAFAPNIVLILAKDTAYNEVQSGD